MSLTKEAPGLTSVLVGLGWDAPGTDQVPFDLDASALLLGADRKVLSDLHFVFYNQKASPEGSVVHLGDNQTGEDESDDETVEVRLANLPAAVETIVKAVTIHEADTRGQNFGQVRNAFIRVVNQSSGEELVRYDLTEDFSMVTALVFGELYRHNTDWKFRAVGQGYSNGLAGIALDFGVSV